MSYELLYGKGPRSGPSTWVVAALGTASVALLVASTATLLVGGGSAPAERAVIVDHLREQAKRAAKQGEPKSPAEIVEAAFDRAVTYRFKRTQRMKTPGSAWTSVRSTGAANEALQLELSEMSSASAGGTSAGKAVMVQHKGVQYLRIDPAMRRGAGIPAAKRWVTYDLESMPQMRETARAFARFGSLKSADLVRDVRVRGARRLGGRSVQMYSARLDFAKYLEAVRKISEKFGDADDTTVQMTGRLDVFIDGTGHVVRAIVRSRATSREGVMRSVIEEDRWGHNRPVGLSVPRPSEVHRIDLSEQFGEREQTEGSWSEESWSESSSESESEVSTESSESSEPGP